jgi:hypothetical protein
MTGLFKVRVLLFFFVGKNQLKREIKMATLKRSILLCMLAFLGMSSIVPAQAAVESDFFYLNLVVHIFNFCI